MATGSTSLLGLALPVTGELDGTWGTVVNDQITSLVDSAIAGTTTLTDDGSATYTLTTNTLAANQARQAILRWDTNDAAKTSTRTIIAPASSKVYVVINKSTYQDIKLCGPGPTTGITVLKSEIVFAAWNGSDFVRVSDPTTLVGKTIQDGTFTNGYTEETNTANTGTAYTIALTDGTLQILTLTGNCTFTFPTPTSGRSFIMFLKQDATGSRTATWPASVKWPNNLNPTLTTNASKGDKFVFTADGTYWWGSVAGQKYL